MADDPTPFRGGEVLIPQKHGGALRPPFPPGNPQSSGAARHAVSFRAVKRQVREIMSESFVKNVTRLQELCESLDDRVSIMALGFWFDRFLGKSSDTGFAADDAVTKISVSHLTDAERTELGEALATVARLTKRSE